MSRQLAFHDRLRSVDAHIQNALEWMSENGELPADRSASLAA